jgi:signal transduction histidine kinase
MEATDQPGTAHHKAKLQFAYLPAFGKYVLEHKLDEYNRDSLAFAREIDFPLLRYLAHIPDEQLLELSRVSNTQLFGHMINNTLAQHIVESNRQWQENQLNIMDKDAVVAKDITLSGYLRKHTWMKLLKDYTPDRDLSFKIMAELDEFQMETDSASFQVFIDMQSDKLEQTNLALRQNESRLLELVDSLHISDGLYKQAQALTHIGNWSWSLADNTILWSDEMYRIYGLEPQAQQITFDSFISFIHPDDRARRAAEIQKSLDTHEPPAYTIRVIRPDSTIVVISGKNEVVLDEAGKATRMLGTCQDITAAYYLHQELEQKNEELKELNHSLQHKNKELERSNKELTSFSYVASHDLQEPLRKIKTYSNMILDSEADQFTPKGKQYFASINASTERMQQLIRDLLAFSRTHTYTDEMEEVDLNDTARDIANQYDELIQSGKLKLDVGKLPAIKGISFQFRQLFENIISNSIKYSKPNVPSRIAIKCQTISGTEIADRGGDPDRTYNRITISDNGIGFEPQYGDKIFEVFQRLHNRDQYTGTGIGLAICKKIVQNHDGIIYATAVPGEGATFFICLPA